MTKYLILFFLVSNCIFAQEKNTGTYDSATRNFTMGGNVYQASFFSQGYASITDGTLFGMIDSTNTVVIPLMYEYIGFYKEGLVAAKKLTKSGFLDKSGNVIVAFKYDLADDFKNGFAKVQQHNKCGLIGKNGKEIVPLIYDYIDNFDTDQSKLARVTRNKKFGFINKSGKEIIVCSYMNANYFSEGLALVTKENGMTGYVDTTGKIIIPFDEYTRAGNFKNGKAEVRKGNSIFYINKLGKVVN